MLVKSHNKQIFILMIITLSNCRVNVAVFANFGENAQEVMTCTHDEET